MSFWQSTYWGKTVDYVIHLAEANFQSYLLIITKKLNNSLQPNSLDKNRIKWVNQHISIASHQNNELSSIQKLGLTLGFIDFYDISSL
jgi:hypothetical protein